jgi:hypothetical protein
MGQGTNKLNQALFVIIGKELFSSLTFLDHQDR